MFHILIQVVHRHVNGQNILCAWSLKGLFVYTMIVTLYFVYNGKYLIVNIGNLVHVLILNSVTQLSEVFLSNEVFG